MRNERHPSGSQDAAGGGRLLSLPDLSEAAGVPMPIILRLCREHPRELPSVGSGSQLFFPEGVVPNLVALYAEEQLERDTGTEEHHALYTLSRARKEREKAAPEPRRSRPEARRPSTRTSTEAPESLPYPEAQDLSDLEERLLRLEETARGLTAELAEALEASRRPYRGEVPGIDLG